MTEEQYENLPALMKEIIEVQRELEKDEEIINLKEWKELHARREMLIKQAAKTYGPKEAK